MAKAFLGISKIRGVKSAMFYNTGAGQRVITIPMKELAKAFGGKK